MSERLPVPVHILKAALKALPALAVSRLLQGIMASLRREQPELFARLAKLDPAVILISPNDLPYGFTLTLSPDGVDVAVAVAGADCSPPLATIKGRLGTLVNLLEGRIDGDMSFFTRDLAISGDTSAVVGLRNTLESADIDVVGSLLGRLGPLETPARRVVLRLDQVVQRARGEFHSVRDALHREAHAGRDPGADQARLSKELLALKARVAKLEAVRLQAKAEAAL